MRRYRERLEERGEMDEDDRTVDQVLEDLGDEEFHRRRDDGRRDVDGHVRPGRPTEE